MRSKRNLSVAILAVAISVQHAPAADPTPSEMGEVYGYYMGQITAMDLISEKYPTLAVRAKAARDGLRTYFRPYITRIDSIANSHGRDQWARLKQQMEAQVRSDLLRIPLTPDKRDNALTYIRQVEREAKGQLPSDLDRVLAKLVPRRSPSVAPQTQPSADAKYKSTKVTFPGCEFSVSFPCQIKESLVSLSGVRRKRYESVYEKGVPYLRADAITLDTAQRIELIRSLEKQLQATAANLGMPNPETRIEKSPLGVVGSLLAVKTAGGHPIQFHCKWVIGETSVLNLLISEPVGTYPSDRTLLFLNSVGPWTTASTTE